MESIPEYESFDRTPRQIEYFKKVKHELEDRCSKGETGLKIKFIREFTEFIQTNNILNSNGRILDLVMTNTNCETSQDLIPMIREDIHHHLYLFLVT
nr:unnamed protein product [Callosobruchus analis]